MNKPTHYDLELAVSEFKRSARDFEKAAKKLMAIMDRMKKRNYEEIKEISGETQRINDFLIQIMDESGQIGEKFFGIKYVIDKKKDQNK